MTLSELGEATSQYETIANRCKRRANRVCREDIHYKNVYKQCWKNYFRECYEKKVRKFEETIHRTHNCHVEEKQMEICIPDADGIIRKENCFIVLYESYVC